jgi:hypothetical protein
VFVQGHHSGFDCFAGWLSITPTPCLCVRVFACVSVRVFACIFVCVCVNVGEGV